MSEGREELRRQLRALGADSQDGELQAREPETLLEIEVEGVDGPFQPHPRNDGGKRLLLHEKSP